MPLVTQLDATFHQRYRALRGIQRIRARTVLSLYLLAEVKGCRS